MKKRYWLLLFAWLLPPSLFSDCVHAVLPQEQTERRAEADLGEERAAKWKYGQTFDPATDTFVIRWKLLEK